MICKSKTHRLYADALEGLYIQTWLAAQALNTLLTSLGDADHLSSGKGMDLHLRQHELDVVTDRIEFGKSELAIATANVNAHFARGCRHVS